MTETRHFPTPVIASLSSGVLLCKFSDMHEAAEFLMGHPIWTHHFASKDLWQAMQRSILEQCPGMPAELPDTTKENYQAKVANLEREVGKVVRIRRGDGKTAMHPLEGIPPGKPVIAIDSPDEAPYVTADQRHLDENTPERAYWHYGYQAALSDVLRLMERDRGHR
jgi:hypothetical protein